MNGLSEGYKRAIDQNGSYGKNQIFWPKTEILGPKKNHFLILTMFWPRPGKSWFFPNKYQSLKKFWVIFWAKTHFWPKKTHFGRTQKRPFLRNSYPDRVRCHSGSFFDGPDVYTKFR